MHTPFRILCAAAIALGLCAAPALAQEEGGGLEICTRDAMIVFDASGSMAGANTQDIFTPTTRIAEVRAALEYVLPNVTRYRKVGLITYGPGDYQQCNMKLEFAPIPNATGPIMSVVNGLTAAGKTPLSAAVQKAADVLHYQTTPGVVVLLTDGEETCGGAPCELGKQLKAKGNVTVHVIAYQMKAVQWMGPQSVLDVKCLAHETGGEYITANTRQDLIEAFEKTLGCPIVSSVRRGVMR